jgi:hypothetical protein
VFRAQDLSFGVEQLEADWLIGGNFDEKGAVFFYRGFA